MHDVEGEQHGDDGTSSLDEVLTIGQVAKRAKWSVSRMRRYLLSRHNACGGRLLVNVGRGLLRPRWTITLRALRAVASGWFLDPAADARLLEHLAEQLEEERGEREALSRRVSAQHERLMVLAGVQTGPALRRAR